jgi:hypothetical protein
VLSFGSRIPPIGRPVAVQGSTPVFNSAPRNIPETDFIVGDENRTDADGWAAIT